jgi:hypothetical protein
MFKEPNIGYPKLSTKQVSSPNMIKRVYSIEKCEKNRSNSKTLRGCPDSLNFNYSIFLKKNSIVGAAFASLNQRPAKWDSFDSFNSFLIWYDSFS